VARTIKRAEPKPVYLNVEIDLDLRRRFAAAAARRGETMTDMLDRMLRRELDEIERTASRPAAN